MLGFAVLGPLTVYDRGGELVPAPTAPMVRGLLGALLVADGMPLSIERLNALLRGREPDDTSKSAIQVAASRLRSWLRDHADDGLGLEHQPAGYALRPGPGDLDSRRFVELTRDGGHDLADDLEPGLGLWRGRVLEDVALLDRGDPLVTHLDQLRLRTATRLARLALEGGRTARAVEPVAAVAAAHLLHEPLHAALIRVLASAQRQAEAVAVFEAISGRLDEELGVKPGEELAQAYAEVTGQRSAPLPVPGQLPSGLVDFTGRAAVLRELDDLVGRGRAAGGMTVAAICGPAGVGKTALAVQWAHRARRLFPDGQLFVNLRGYALDAPVRSVDALRQFVHALGIPDVEIPVDLDAAAALYRSLLAGRQMLVVLDNARDAEHVRPLLPGSASCLALVTSRDRLTSLTVSDGARRLRLGSLDIEEAVELLGRVVGGEAVQRQPEAARELAVLCGGLPLAVRIVAARLSDFPSPDLAVHVAELGHRDRLAGLQTGPDSRTSVRSTFDTSYRSRSPGARRLFCVLATVPGEEVALPTVAAAAGVSRHRARRYASELVALHLLQEPEPGRFTFHDLLRHYAVERAELELTEAERAAAISGFLAYLQAGVDRAATLIYPQQARPPAATREADLTATPDFDDQDGAWRWLDRERRNLVDAIVYASDHDRPEPCWRLADALRGYFGIRRYAGDWLRVAQRAVRAAARSDSALGQAFSHHGLALARRALGDNRAAVVELTSALGHFEVVSCPPGRASVLNHLGVVYSELGQARTAMDHLQRAVDQHRLIGRSVALAGLLNNIGSVRHELGDLKGALADMTEGLDLYVEAGVRHGEALMRTNLGEIRSYLGESTVAARDLAEGLSLHREIGDPYGECIALNSLTRLAVTIGDQDGAEAYSRAALEVSERTGDRRLQAHALGSRGLTAQHAGDSAAATRAYEASLALATETGDRQAEIGALIGLAAATGAHERAEEAVALALTSEYPVWVADARIAAARLHAIRGDQRRSQSEADQALALCLESGYRYGEAQARLLLGEEERAAEILTAIRSG